MPQKTDSSSPNYYFRVSCEGEMILDLVAYDKPDAWSKFLSRLSELGLASKDIYKRYDGREFKISDMKIDPWIDWSTPPAQTYAYLTDAQRIQT